MRASVCSHAGARTLDFSPNTNTSHAETELQQQISTKMSISFLLNNDDRVQEPRGVAQSRGSKDNMRNRSHQKKSSVLSTGELHHLGNRPHRTDDFVGFRSPTLGMGLDPAHAISRDIDTPHRQRLWPQTQFSGHAGGVSLATNVLSPEQGPTITGFTSPNHEHPRALRPVYTYDEKLFIMHAKVIGDLKWPEVSGIFGNIFGRTSMKHSISNLTFAYYCTRQDWGMEIVVQDRLSQHRSDNMIVSMKLNERAVR